MSLPNKRDRYRIKLWSLSLHRRWRAFWETNFPYAILLLVVCIVIMTGWRLIRPDVFPDLWTEMGGTTLEVLLFLIIFASFEHRRSRRQFIERQRETIDDYKRWDNPEAQVRIAGAIRRLDKMGISAIDFSGIRLSDFSFANHGIARLTGSSFYEGTWGKPMQETGVALTNVSFDHIDCSDVEFSPFDPFQGLAADLPRYAKLWNCSFVDSDLRRAKFNGASLDWSDTPPESLYEVWEEEGEPSGSVQVRYSPFDRADLSGASFRACRFTNADFRNAEGLISADFFRAAGLESAEFDDDEIKSAVLTNARRSENSS